MRTVLGITCVFAALVAATASSVQHERALQHIDRAGKLLFENSEDIPQGVAALLDAVAELTARGDASTEVRTSIQTARQELAAGRAVNDERIGGLLRDAYKALHSGEPFKPSRSEELSELMDQLKHRVTSARNAATTGNASEGARILVGVALAIVTPVQE